VIGSFDPRHQPGAIADINLVPLVDGMQVLPVIFIITAPLLTHAAKIDLPKAASDPNVTQAEPIEFGIRADGSYYWNEEAVASHELAGRFAPEWKRRPNPNCTTVPTGWRTSSR
jgi:biopolymer transport protein ExbD